MQEISYTANAGQTYIPFQDNSQVKPLPFTPLSRPEPAIPELELNPLALEKKAVRLSEFCPHDFRNHGRKPSGIRRQRRSDQSAGP